jgi:hypothetical protein
MKRKLIKVLLLLVLGTIATTAIGQTNSQAEFRKFSYAPLKTRQDLKNLVTNNLMISEEYSKNIMLISDHYGWGFTEVTLQDLYTVFDEAEIVKVTDGRMVRVGFIENGRVVYGKQSTGVNPLRYAVIYRGIIIGYLDCGNTILQAEIQQNITFQETQAPPVRYQSDNGVDFRNAQSRSYNSGYSQPVATMRYVIPPKQETNKLTTGQKIFVGAAVIGFGSLIAYAIMKNNRRNVPPDPYTPPPPPDWEPGGGEGWLDKAVLPPGPKQSWFTVGFSRSF